MESNNITIEPTIQEPVVISGASGLIGMSLVQYLRTKGILVRTLVRREVKEKYEYNWDPRTEYVDPSAFKNAGTIIHLAGSPVNRRWTRKARNDIVSSRVQGTRCIVESAVTHESIQSIVIASAIGFYGHAPNASTATEDTEQGDGFLASTCAQWEKAAEYHESQFNSPHIATARIGVVLDPSGGALAQANRVANRIKLVPYVGNGRQWISWISMLDCIKALEFCAAHNLNGPINLVAPNPIIQHEFARQVARSHGLRTLAIPRHLVSLGMGQMGREIAIGGRRVEATRLIAQGFKFEQPCSVNLIGQQSKENQR